MDSKRSMATFALFITLINLLLFTQAISTSETTCFSVPNSLGSVNTTDQQSSNWPATNTTSGSGQSGSSCPIDTLKLGACVELLAGMVDVWAGHVPNDTKCCPLIQGLADLEAAACLCTAIKANILGMYLNLPVSLSLLLNLCSKNVPPEDFQCA